MEAKVDAAAGTSSGPAPRTEGAWAETLDLAVGASERVQAAERRNRELEERVRALEERLQAEISTLRARSEKAEQTLVRVDAARVAAEDRGRKAEERAEAAEAFIRRINQAVRPLARSGGTPRRAKAAQDAISASSEHEDFAAHGANLE
jgi:chromosome segregation ATPase